jgi:hypothetical protein
MIGDLIFEKFSLHDYVGGITVPFVHVLFALFCQGQWFVDKRDNTRDKRDNTRDKRDKRFGQIREKRDKN